MIPALGLVHRRQQFTGICVDLTGGLGNQLFGFAAGWTQARRLGIPLGLRHHRQRRETPRTFELSWLLDAPQVELCTNPPRRSFREASFAYDPAIEGVQAGTRLVGYFQSWRYSQEYADDLRALLVEHGRLPQPGSISCIAVHARRGDYLGARQLAFHGICHEGYYVNAVRELRESMGDVPVQVFSDDAGYGAYLADQITHASAVTQGGSAEQVLGHMAQAQGLVISNSSFSWWAGWLAGDAAQVIAPAPWFSDPAMSIGDLLPPT